MSPFSYELAAPDPVHLGLIVLQADETIEQDFRRLIPDNIPLNVSRVPSGLNVSRESLREMEKHIPQAAGLFPRGIDYDCVGYGCTSGTSVIGQERVRELVQKGTTTGSVTEPVSALIAACRYMTVDRIALLSPYVEGVSQGLRNNLREKGIQTPVFGSFEESEEARVVRIAPDAIFRAACDLASSHDVQAIFLSCTNLRTLDVIDRIEQACGKPVLTSNQVLAWHMCNLARVGGKRSGFGRLNKPRPVP